MSSDRLPDRRQRSLDPKQVLQKRLLPLKNTTPYNVHGACARFLWRVTEAVKPGHPESRVAYFGSTLRGHENDRSSPLCLTFPFSANMAWEGRRSEWINTSNIVCQSQGTVKC